MVWVFSVWRFCPGGSERTIPEFEALLAEAGLKINRLIPTECYISVLEVVAA